VFTTFDAENKIWRHEVVVLLIW